MKKNSETIEFNMIDEELHDELQTLETEMMTEGEKEADDAGSVVALRQFFGELANIRQTTEEEEQELGRLIGRGRVAKQLLKETDDKELAKVLEEEVEAGKQAAKKLAEGNIRLVVSVVKRYHTRRLESIELIDEGYIGLMRAAGTFDITRGYKFSTYAVRAIMQAMLRAVSEKDGFVDMNHHIASDIKKLVKAREAYINEYGREPSIAELAEFADFASDKVVGLIHGAEEGCSLDVPIGEDGNSTLMDILVDRGCEMPEDAAQRADFARRIRKVVLTLPEKERYIIIKFFGLDCEEHTLGQIAEELKLSKERVRQMRENALARLRRKTELKDYVKYPDIVA